MKKIILLSIIIGFAISTMAQNQMTTRKNKKRVQDSQEVAVERIQKALTPELKQGETVNEDVSQVYVGMAGQQLCIRREEAHVVSYNYEIDVISVTCILDPETYPNISGISTVGMWYSADKGQSWSDPVILNANADYYNVSGALFNPDGNTIVENMFGVHQGVGFPNSSYLDFGSSTLGGEYLNNYIYELSGYSGSINIFGLNQFGNEMRCSNLLTDGSWSSNNFYLQLIVGEFDAGEFDWDMSNVIDPKLLIGGDGIVAWVGVSVVSDSGYEIAWSDDGEIGYIWMLAVADTDPTGYQPVVFRTDNAGESWDYIYLDFFNAEMQSILEPYLYESSAGYLIPHVFESAGVVDAHGDLQMMVAMGSTSADVITYPDSLGYTWVYPGDLFNVVVDEGGISELMWVDSLRTENVLWNTQGNYCGSIGWQHRISAAKSENEKQVFFTWLDTRNINDSINLRPDLFGWGTTVYGGMMENTICFSQGSELEEIFYFSYGSDKAYYDLDEGTFIIPYLQGVTQLEFLINTNAATDPITLSYVTGIEFPDLLIGVEEFASASEIQVTQNMPNPFTGSTTIEVSTKTATSVTVEVSNIMGQSMYTLNAGTVNGTQEIELSARNLEAGIYFYTVRVGGQSITKKMIVK